jgi:hypothetical protein
MDNGIKDLNRINFILGNMYSHLKMTAPIGGNIILFRMGGR